MKKIVIVFMMSISLYSCTKKEEVDPGADKCYITGVTVNTFPLSDNGKEWDVSVGDDQYADVTFSLSNSTVVIYEHDKYKEDVFTDDLPFTLTMNDYYLPNMTIDYGVFLYDYDVTSADDFIGGGSFNPDDYKVDRPSSININTAGVDMDVSVRWED